MAIQVLKDFHSDEKERRIIRRTSLILGGYPLWQTATDQRVVEVIPDLEEIMCWGSYVVRLIGDDLMMIDDNVSRAYIRCYPPKDDSARMAKLEHLSRIQWVAE